MVLPQTAEYALRATICLAQHFPTRPVRVGELAAATGVPRNYLAKTLHQLVRAGVLQSTRGPAGGFTLAHPPERLTLARIMAPFAAASERRCLLGHGECGVDPRCAVHERWRPAAAAMTAFFGATTLGDLIAAPQRGDSARADASTPPSATPIPSTCGTPPARLP